MRRLEDDDSDNEGADDPALEREIIAEKIFVGGSDEVSRSGLLLNRFY